MSHKNDKRAIHSIRTQIDSFGRKKYKLEQVFGSDKEQVEQDKKDSIIETGRYKSMLIGRQQTLNIEKYVGKIDTNKKKKVTQVFYCDVCSQGFKCDIAYITHLNSPAHNRKIGMNMKVKAVSLQSISSKISSLITKKQLKQEQTQEQLIRNIKDYQQIQQDQKGQSSSMVKQENPQQVAKQQEVQNQAQEEENGYNQDQEQLQMMRQLGLPTAFGNKKRKR